MNTKTKRLVSVPFKKDRNKTGNSMTDQLESNPKNESLGDVGYARREILKYGSAATAGAILGTASLLNQANAASSQAVNTGTLDANDPLNIVISVYHGGTLLDFAGPCEIFRRLPNTNVRIASLNGGPVMLEFGVVYGNTERLADIEKADLLLVPGGPDLTEPTKLEYISHVKRLAKDSKYITSVCTGSLVLAAAGLLKGKRSACHWAFLNNLAEYGAIPDPARFVEDDNGRFMSGGGVTSGIDFALRVAARLRGQVAAEFAQLIVEYDPDPPFRSGHPRVAPPEVLAMAEKRLPGATKGLRKIPGII